MHKSPAEDAALGPPVASGSVHVAVGETEDWIKTANKMWLPKTFLVHLPADRPESEFVVTEENFHDRMHELMQKPTKF